MLLIECPYCGSRDESEFSYSGEAYNVRPENPESVSDKEWANYLFYRDNLKGNHFEQWSHSSGCRRFFNLERDTETYEIRSVYKIGEMDAGTK